MVAACTQQGVCQASGNIQEMHLCCSLAVHCLIVSQLHTIYPWLLRHCSSVCRRAPEHGAPLGREPTT